MLGHRVASPGYACDRVHLDDDVLDVIEIARGDQVALGRLYDRYSPLLMAVGQRIVGDRREAEDLVHDVFLEVWRRAGDFDPARGSVKTWLLVRMRSRCLDRVKSAGYARVDRDTEGMERRPKTPVEGQTPSRMSDGARVREALAALPEPQREVLVLGYFEGLSCSEIAAQLAVPIGTVKSRMATAMARLRDALLSAQTEATT